MEMITSHFFNNSRRFQGQNYGTDREGGVSGPWTQQGDDKAVGNAAEPVGDWDGSVSDRACQMCRFHFPAVWTYEQIAQQAGEERQKDERPFDSGGVIVKRFQFHKVNIILFWS